MLTRNNTKQLKAIAILLMLAHHLYTFPERIPYSFDISTHIVISGLELSQCIGNFGKICVAIFMFLGGYGLYASSVSACESTDTTLNIIKKNLFVHIIKLYKVYWKVFLIFVPVGFIFFDNQPKYNASDLGSIFSGFTVSDFFSNFLGFSSSYNWEWWFLRTYIFALFEGIVFLEIFLKKNNIYIECFTIVIWHVLIACVFPQIASIEILNTLAQDFWFSNIFTINDYSSMFFVGIIFSKYNIFNVWNAYIDVSCNEFKMNKIVIALITICICVYTRVFVAPVTFDLILVPVFLFAVLIVINSCLALSKSLLLVGKHSTNMWLTHSFYCYYFYPFVKMVYCSNNFIISYLTLFILSLLTSFVINFVWKYIGIFLDTLNSKVSI